MKRILLLAVCSSLLTACGKQDKAGVEGPTGNVEDDFVFVKGFILQFLHFIGNTSFRNRIWMIICNFTADSYKLSAG